PPPSAAPAGWVTSGAPPSAPTSAHTSTPPSSRRMPAPPFTDSPPSEKQRYGRGQGKGHFWLNARTATLKVLPKRRARPDHGNTAWAPAERQRTFALRIGVVTPSPSGAHVHMNSKLM